MERSLPTVLVLARCTQTQKEFAMRFEQRGQQSWHLVARLLRTSTQSAQPSEPDKWWQRVGIGRSQNERSQSQPDIHISGSIVIDPLYRGCPHCEAIDMYAGTFTKCAACGKVSCWNITILKPICPWCGYINTFNPDHPPVATLRGVEIPAPARVPMLGPAVHNASRLHGRTKVIPVEKSVPAIKDGSKPKLLPSSTRQS